VRGGGAGKPLSASAASSPFAGLFFGFSVALASARIRAWNGVAAASGSAGGAPASSFANRVDANARGGRPECAAGIFGKTSAAEIARAFTPPDSAPLFPLPFFRFSTGYRQPARRIPADRPARGKRLADNSTASRFSSTLPRVL
jgi:hypothetical protein